MTQAERILGGNMKNTHLIRSHGIEVKQTLGSKAFYQSLGTTSSTEASRKIKEWVEFDKKAQRVCDTIFFVLKGNEILIESTVAAAYAAAPATGGASLLYSALGTAGSKGLEEVTEWVKEKCEENIGRRLKTSMMNYEKNTSQRQYEELLKIEDPEEFLSELYSKTDEVFGRELDTIAADRQPEVNGLRLRFVKKEIETGFRFVNSRVSLLEEELDSNARNIVGLGTTLQDFEAKAQEQLNGLLETQEEIQIELTQLNSRIGKTQKGVEYIEGFLFGKMSPTEKLNALENGMLDSTLPQNEREILEQKIRLEKKRQDFANEIAEYLDGANQLVGIAENIAHKVGMSPKLVTGMKSVVKVSSTVFKAIVSFSSMNFLAGVSAITSLFGLGGGRDIAGERHEQIMEAIGELYDKVGEVERKVDQLIQGQQEIKENQRRVFNAIVKLSEQLRDSHRQTMDKLQEILEQVLINKKLIINDALVRYSDCELMRRNPLNYNERILDTGAGVYPSYQSFRLFYGDHKETIEKGFDQLRQTRIAPAMKFSQVFRMESYKDLNGDYLTVNESEVYLPALKVINFHASGESDELNRLVSSLLAPMATTKALDEKFSATLDASSPRYRASLGKLMENLLYPNIVIMHCDYIIDCHYYLMLLDSKSEVIKFEDLLDGASVMPLEGLFLLNEALSIADIAIAQQSLLCGDILLPIIFEIKEKIDTGTNTEKERDAFFDFCSVIDHNPCLAQNYLVYALSRDIRANSNLLNFSIAENSTNNSYLLDSCTKLKWKFEWSPNDILDEDGNVLKSTGWNVKLNEKYYSMPSAQDLLDGTMNFKSELLSLLTLRKRLVEEIKSYQIFDGLSPTEIRSINSVVLNSL